MSVRRKLTTFAAPFYILQAAAVAAWWLLLWLYPPSRRYFLPAPIPQAALLAFAGADLVVIAAGSTLAAIRRSPWRAHAAWAVAGAACYATLYCLMLSILTGGAWLSVLLMLPSATTSLVFAWLLSGMPVFREARSQSPAVNLAKTFTQILVFWGTFLWVLPALIRRVEDELAITRFEFATQEQIGFGVFVLLSCLGLWSARSMAAAGLGTPLPLDAPQRLVVDGPYAYIRNPMAVAGLGQSLAVALGTGSIATALYTIAGGIAWNYTARPLEEEDMAAKFGTEFDAYRSNVRCWLPRLTPYRVTSASVVSLPPRD